jgi:hypothetical protein
LRVEIFKEKGFKGKKYGKLLLFKILGSMGRRHPCEPIGWYTVTPILASGETHTP